MVSGTSGLATLRHYWNLAGGLVDHLNKRAQQPRAAGHATKQPVASTRPAVAMAQFVGKPLPDFSVKPLQGGELGAKTSLKGLAAGRPLVRSRRVQ